MALVSVMWNIHVPSSVRRQVKKGRVISYDLNMQVMVRSRRRDGNKVLTTLRTFFFMKSEFISHASVYSGIQVWPFAV